MCFDQICDLTNIKISKAEIKSCLMNGKSHGVFFSKYFNIKEILNLESYHFFFVIRFCPSSFIPILPTYSSEISYHLNFSTS